MRGADTASQQRTHGAMFERLTSLTLVVLRRLDDELGERRQERVGGGEQDALDDVERRLPVFAVHEATNRLRERALSLRFHALAAS